MDQTFTLADFRAQFDQLRKLGMLDTVGRIPGMAALVREGDSAAMFARRVEELLDAMTEAERRDPALIGHAALVRIAAAAAVGPEDVAGFLTGFLQVQAMMRRMNEMSLRQRLKLVLGFGHDSEGDDPTQPPA